MNYFLTPHSYRLWKQKRALEKELRGLRRDLDAKLIRQDAELNLLERITKSEGGPSEEAKE